MDQSLERSGQYPVKPGRSPRLRSQIQSLDNRSKTELPSEQVRRVARRDKGRAAKVIKFIEELIVPSGKGQGHAFKLRDWQKDFIRDIYEPVNDEGHRVVRRAILSIARKNGKTALIAALALAHLIGPEAVKNGEIYSAANDRDQAGQVYKVASQIVRADPELSQMLRCIDSTKTIAYYAGGSFYRAISAEAGTKHGLNPTFAIFDELAQAKNRNLYDVLDTSFGARLEPLFVVISTQSNDPEHVLSRLIDDGLSADDPSIVCHLFSVPEDEKDIYDPTVWKKANPALGDFRSLEDLRLIAEKAKRVPAEEPKFRNLYLNQRVASTSTLLSRPEWMACAGKEKIPDGAQVYLGLDLSSTNDLTALVMGTAGDKTVIETFFWKPEATLSDHSSRDFGGGNHRYEIWKREGHLLTSPGKTINPAVVAYQIAELRQRYNIVGMAYDRWRVAELLRELDAIGCESYNDHDDKRKGSGLRIVPWGQGFRDMAPAIDALELEVLERTLVHPNNPVLNWNVANAVAMLDPAGNRKIDKESSRVRIDGAVAMAMMCGLKARDRKVKPINVMAMIS